MQQNIDRLVQYYSRRGPVVLLESQSRSHRASHYSYLAAVPISSIKAWNQKVEIKEDGKLTTFEANPWDALAEYRSRTGDWLLGYLGYDLKNHIEVLSSKNPDNVQAPDLFFMQPEVLLRIDHRASTVEVIKGALPKELEDLDQSNNVSINDLHATVKKNDYISSIEAAQHEIFEGSYYEINLSHQLRAAFRGSSFQLYQLMRRIGPVPFGAFIQFDDFAVCSMSPERFLGKEGRSVFSQPIKGTMKRDEQIDKDRALKQKLIDSGKDRAENLMIVDLVRNDLSRIAREGSVQVADLFEIQSFGTVHQMVSTIKAETAVDDPVEVIKACYPMGSMTGAPKIRAMQHIDLLENYRRGIYSGAIGYFTPYGDFDLSVVIRTAIIKNEQLYYAVGGAITSDSDPEEEWNETWLKARALTDAIK